jgi:hypothetical protein
MTKTKRKRKGHKLSVFDTVFAPAGGNCMEEECWGGCVTVCNYGGKINCALKQQSNST